MTKLSKLIKYNIKLKDFTDLIDHRVFENEKQPEIITKARKFLNLIPVSSAEDERGLSTMNYIANDKRSKLLIENISSLASSVA